MKKVLFYLGVFVIIAFIIFSLFYIVNINSAVDKHGETKLITIESGSGLNAIATQLKSEGLIQSRNLFIVYVRNSGLQSKLQAGEYELSPSLSIKEIAKRLSHGDAETKEARLQFIEGWTTRDIAEYLEEQGVSTSEEFLNLVGYPKVDYRYEKNLPEPKDYSAEFSFLADKPSYYGLEGYLFPDTYLVYKNGSLDNLATKMLTNFDNKLTADMRAEIAKQGKTINQVIIMASLIEKEATIKNNDNTDAKIISGIFWDRIKYGQALESCASLAYITGEYKAQYSLADTRIESPYNTYRNKGLPPTPVSNPGLLAIEAAIYPTYTDYNYFLSPVGSDTTIFAKTYEEHLQNKAKYLP